MAALVHEPFLERREAGAVITILREAPAWWMPMGLGLELTLLVSQLGHGRGRGQEGVMDNPCQVNLTLKMSALSAVAVAPRRGQRTGERECGRGDQGGGAWLWGPGQHYPAEGVLQAGASTWGLTDRTECVCKHSKC